MDTGIRRFILRFVVGVLTFAIGVGAAILLGGFSFFRSHSPTSYENSRGCEYRKHTRSFSIESSRVEAESTLLKTQKGGRVKRSELRDSPPVPLEAEAPIPRSHAVPQR